jgi:hypothetical protein
MEKYIEILLNSYSGYFNYLKNEILYLNWDNYFYGLIHFTGRILLLYFLGAKNAILRKDFGSIYFIFFQFFLLNLILLIALSNVMEQFINDTSHIWI